MAACSINGRVAVPTGTRSMSTPAALDGRSAHVGSTIVFRAGGNEAERLVEGLPELE